MQEAVVVYRGTDVGLSGNDWLYSNICFAIGCIPLQYKDALSFFDSVREELGADLRYSVSGHSLGGGLSQLVAIDRNVEAYVYDSPGVLRVAQNLFPERTIDVFAKNGQIHSFISAFNVVNSATPHLVDSIQVKQSVLEHCNKMLPSYTVDLHSMEELVKDFDQETGKPFYEKHISKDDMVGNKHSSFDIISSIRNISTSFSERCREENHIDQAKLYELYYNFSPIKHKITITSNIIPVDIFLHFPSEPTLDSYTEDFKEYSKSRILSHVKHNLSDKTICSLTEVQSWKLTTDLPAPYTFHTRIYCEERTRLESAYGDSSQKYTFEVMT